MPGRRYPRRSQQEAQSSHARSVFAGGLDGASSTPYPVGLKQDQSGAKGKCAEVLFFNEEFSANGDAQSVTLIFLPLPYSEHVYLWRGGQGTYQSQDITWTRDTGSRTINVLSSMKAQAGDSIVVEYAYYAQIPGITDECGPQAAYPTAILKGASTLTKVGNNYILPPAENFPVVIVDNDYGHKDDWWMGFQGYAGSSSVNAVVSRVPGIAPGSSHARKLVYLTGTENKHLDAYLDTFTGEEQPRWGKATTLGQSVWFSRTGTLDPSQSWLTLEEYMWYHHDGDTYSINHMLSYNFAGANEWYVRSEWDIPNAYGASVYQEISLPYLGDPLSPGPHFLSYSIDLLTKTMHVKFDDNTHSFTHQSLWPEPEVFEFEQWTEQNFTWDYFRENELFVSYSTSLVVDDWAIKDDVPFCKWENAPVPDPCLGAPVYPIVRLPDAASILLIGADSGAHPERLTYTPTSEDMPSDLQPLGEPWHGGFAYNDNSTSGPQYQLYVGPSITSGYANSWASGPVNNKTQHVHGIALYGGETEPRLNLASHVRYSLWANMINYRKALPTDSTGGAAHDVDIVLWNRFARYEFTYNPHLSSWNLYTDVSQWEVPFSELAVPVSMSMDPYSPGTHWYEIDMNITTSTLTFTVDSESWSLTEPLLWPYGEYWEDYPMRPGYLRGDDASISGSFFAGSYGSLGGVWATLRTCGQTVETDAPWCAW
jgi:hypothetical protein